MIDYMIHILIVAGIYVILAGGLSLVVGFAGQPAMGHAAFFCIGAYTSSLLVLVLDVSPFVGLLAGAALSAMLGGLVAYPAVRLRGDYLALATFGIAVIVHGVAKNWISLTRGPMGLPAIPGFSVGQWELTKSGYLGLVVVAAGMAIWGCSSLTRSPFGRDLLAIREDETAARALGKNTATLKLEVFVASAFLAGIAGSFYAHYVAFIDPSSFMPMESLTMLLMVIFGGMGSNAGAALGAVALVVLPELLRLVGISTATAAAQRQILYGLLLVGLMVWRPQGLMGRYSFGLRR